MIWIQFKYSFKYFQEANAFPDFKQSGENLNDLISCLFYQTIAVACDSYFNESPVCVPDKMHLVYEKKNIFLKN